MKTLQIRSELARYRIEMTIIRRGATNSEIIRANEIRRQALKKAFLLGYLDSADDTIELHHNPFDGSVPEPELAHHWVQGWLEYRQQLLLSDHSVPESVAKFKHRRSLQPL